METFTSGKYLGQNAEQVKLGELLITRSSYKETFSSGWHRHENTYITFILKGGSTEKRKKQEIECLPGMLLLYPRYEMHKNLHYKNNSKNLHIEFSDSWFKKFDIDVSDLEGRLLVNDPLLKCGLMNIIAEMHVMDQQTAIDLEAALLAAISGLTVAGNNNGRPAWVKKLHELLHDEAVTGRDLEALAQQINVHPVTISRYFPKYFKANIGDYIRMIKIERSMALLSKKSIPMEEVALKSGFADNAHYTRVFKKYSGITPSYYRTFVAG